MGNGFAYGVLAIWPLIAIYLYRVKSIQIATLWTILGGFMFLAVKTEVDLPMIPPLGKHTVPVVSALLGVWFVKNKRISFFKGLGKIKYLVILFVSVPFITAGLNGEAIVIGGRFFRGLSYYDGLSAVINQCLLVIPFFIGRAFFRTYDDQLIMFKVLLVAGLLYSLPMLYEVRMSPQLHRLAYDYFPHSFLQQKRFGGFRPVVFMGHGLLVSFFAFVVLTSAVTLWKNRVRVQNLSPAILSYFFVVVLILCKSVASIFYGLFAFIAIKRTSFRTQYRVAIFLVILAMLYPTMSILKAFPHQALIDVATSIDSGRAESLQFRFDNETTLLEHGREKFFFGWGGWGRNRLHDENTGKDISVTDGRWIITFGQFGIMGFIAEFGLLAVTVFRAYEASKLLKHESEKILHASHALLVAIIMIDQLPNASLAPWLWLVVGILLGRSEEIISKDKDKLVTLQTK
ncbi:hypothetical protein [Cycloclasticus zancles]|jgi:hypothetical protein|uniref:O-antigen polymerase n=1 Tax=Cycloclasticus zancles 78-ME TaxID=1198232 RepID=S5T873_9GAMM|nr:hypothetical protein [Cycloclasticus zancles]AGS39789.1 hypothetical protein CYCME_1461 [Cycloclasticus zancles 78-ME]KXJ53209.1 MAG: hypothetical protein AXW17_06965 [Colwellia sp. Phe_37]